MRSLAELLQIFKNQGITGYRLQKDLDISQVGADKIIDGRSPNPRRHTLIMLNRYVDNDFKPLEDYETSIVKNKSISNNDLSTQRGTPYYDIDFTAGFLEIENNQQTKPDHYVTHPFFNNCDFIVRASGQSMAKVIKHGDAIGLIKIENWKDFLLMGEIYAIVSNNGFRMIKIITKGDDKESYTLLSKPSDSKKDEFPPQQIMKKHIMSIFKVQASSHLF